MLCLVLLALVAVGAACADAGPSTPDETASTAEAPPQPFPRDAVVDYQLGGPYPPAEEVTVVVRDRTERPDPDRYSVCYVNVFQTQPGSLAWWREHHPSLLLEVDGRLVRDPGWPDEVLLDHRTAAQRAELVAVVAGWFRGCRQAGFEAVEADNLDAWTRSAGALTQEQTEATARAVVRAAHGAVLAIAQKNAPELDGRALGFDLAVAEECQVYDECGAYTEVYGAAVVEVEYTDNGVPAFEEACRERAGEHPILLRDRDVVPRGEPGHVSRHC